MNCVFCGDEIEGRPIRQEGQVYCTTDCVDTSAEVGIDDDQYRMEEVLDDNSDLDFYEEGDDF